MHQFLIVICIYLISQIITFCQQATAKSSNEICLPLKNNIPNNFSQSDHFFRPILPLVSAKSISSKFGKRKEPFSTILQDHKGVDYPAIIGSAIIATEGGTVLRSGYSVSYGNIVEIDHGFGIISKYAHASKLLVHVGQIIQKGQVIALVGNTGNSTGPHLHFEIAQKGLSINPLDIFNEGFQVEQTKTSNLHSINNQQTLKENFSFDRKNIKPYFMNGEIIVAVRVRSGKSNKW
jgi:hypothetical protein